MTKHHVWYKERKHVTVRLPPELVEQVDKIMIGQDTLSKIPFRYRNNSRSLKIQLLLEYAIKSLKKRQ